MFSCGVRAFLIEPPRQQPRAAHTLCWLQWPTNEHVRFSLDDALPIYRLCVHLHDRQLGDLAVAFLHFLSSGRRCGITEQARLGCTERDTLAKNRTNNYGALVADRVVWVHTRCSL